MEKPVPQRECDIVMKGGITSGLVYPLAVVELSQQFRFRNVGGTSAGAIAAAATAAAELGRGKPDAGFDLLAKLPNWLGEEVKDGRGSRMLNLFQPQPHTRGLFEVLRAALEPKNKLLNLGRAALGQFWRYGLVGLLPGLLLLGLTRPTHFLLDGLGLLAGLLVMALGALAGVGLGLLRSVGHSLPANGYGLCNGYSADPDGPNPPLTGWLHRYLNQLAARPPDGPPLTFGDLQKGGVALQMMTSNLTHGLPYRLPLDSKIFYFDKGEFAKLFPPAVVAHLLEASKRTGRPKAKDLEGRELFPLPNPDDFPVVVAVRLSLSFPALISAVPLYAADDSKRTSEQRFPPLERCWFSDGGITSNFPVHFFDTPLPVRPTFAINLIPLDGKKTDSSPAEKVVMAMSNKGGLSVLWSRFDQTATTPPQAWQSWLGLPGLGHLLGFAGAIFSTAQNWTDNSQLTMPGYRDRIAHIGLTKDEGGLNLAMPEEVITDLTQRGQAAGQKLTKRFTAEPEKEKLSWLNHSWVRYRATMASLEGYLFDLHDQYTTDPSFKELIEQERSGLANSYALDVYPPKGIDQRGFALETMDDLMQTVGRWKTRAETKRSSFGTGAPNPRAELRAQPGPRPQDNNTPTPETQSDPEET